MPIATGTIYRIICLPEPNIQYIGSTFTTTKQRWAEHKKFYKIYCIGNSNQGALSIFKYFDKYGINNFKLIKIKEYQVWREHQKDTKQLRAYEQLWINRTRCVNQYSAFGIKYLTSKDWRIRNKKHIKKYYQKNKNYILQQKKEYVQRPEVKEHRKEYQKEYDKNRPKITCLCGSEFRKSDIRRHERSKKHIEYLESLN